MSQEEFDCPICGDNMNNMNNNSTLFISHCGHTYHTRCIKQWLLTKNNCPMCRNKLWYDFAELRRGRKRKRSHNGNEIWIDASTHEYNIDIGTSPNGNTEIASLGSLANSNNIGSVFINNLPNNLNNTTASTSSLSSY